MSATQSLTQVRDEMISCRGLDPDYINEITQRTFGKWISVINAVLAEPAPCEYCGNTGRRMNDMGEMMYEELSDHELLELAAKAVGLTLKWIGDEPSVPYTPEESQLRGVDGYMWNPLTDDGDALRLAVELNIAVFIYDDETSTATKGIVAKNWGSKQASTRRVIVITAARIGKGIRDHRNVK